MKKFVCAALVLLYSFLSCIPLVPTRAHAATDAYACILQENVYFYESESTESGLFILPQTYYVKVLFASHPFTKVEYLTDSANSKKRIGYCKTEELTFVNYTPKNPYLYHVFDVTYTAEQASGQDDFFHKITLTCTYYGNYTIGAKTYAYVLQGTQFGYVPLPVGFTYPKNTEHADATSPEANSPTTPPGDAGTNPAQIAILVVLCLLVPLLAALVLRSSKKRPFDFDEH